jgi:hypothetical protein
MDLTVHLFCGIVFVFIVCYGQLRFMYRNTIFNNPDSPMVRLIVFYHIVPLDVEVTSTDLCMQAYSSLLWSYYPRGTAVSGSSFP